MISEWSYDSANDVYSYPRGPVESSTLKGFQLGALKSDKISRYVTTKKNTTINNNKEGILKNEEKCFESNTCCTSCDYRYGSFLFCRLL